MDDEFYRKSEELKKRIDAKTAELMRRNGMGYNSVTVDRAEFNRRNSVNGDLSERIDAKIDELRHRSVTDKSLTEIHEKQATVKETPESHISKMNIYEFLELRMKTGKYYKLAGMVTGKQTVFQVARGDLDNHWSMESKVIQSIFPNRRIDMSNLYDDAIGVFGLGYDISIDIPSRISFQQYEVLLDIVEQVKRFEKDYGKEIELFDADAILKEAQAKLSNFYPIENDEKIVGVPIDEHIIIDSINRELNIADCKDAKELRNIAFTISKYYNDNYFKNIILKIIPNAEQIIKINNGLSAWEFSYSLEDIPLNIENLSYDNIQNYLQQLLSEVEKKKVAEDYDRMYNEALKENEEFERKKAEDEARQKEDEIRQYSEMYEQALKENEKFDLEKAEEAKKYSEMYEQAIKENQEFDKRKEEERYQTLVNNEEQARQAWKDNLSSYESYSNYKSAIKDRLEIEKQENNTEQSNIDDYEEKKKAYEEVSASTELIEHIQSKNKEEIDADLNDFEEQERKILNSKHFTEEQKRQMIEQLYSEFNEYTEQNPELSERHM